MRETRHIYYDNCGEFNSISKLIGKDLAKEVDDINPLWSKTQRLYRILTTTGTVKRVRKACDVIDDNCKSYKYLFSFVNNEMSEIDDIYLDRNREKIVFLNFIQLNREHDVYV